MDNNLQIENGKFTRISNKIIEELVKMPLLGTEFAICLFVIRKTYGYNKKEDEISISQFEEATRRSRPTIVKALKNLQLVNILQLVKKGDSKKHSNCWAFNKYYDTYKLVNTPKLVKYRDTTSKVNALQLVKTPKHTKDNTKDNTKDTIATTVAEEKFNSELYLLEASKSKIKHIALIGEYLIGRKTIFPTKKAAQIEIKRWVKDASFLADYPKNQIDQTAEYVREKWPNEWNLHTIAKFINQKQNGNK